MATMKKPAKKYADGGPVTTSTKTTKKPKTVSQRIGDITLRDVKNAGEDALNIATLGGYSKVKKALGGEYKYKKPGEKKNGGAVKKAQNGINTLLPGASSPTKAKKYGMLGSQQAKSGVKMKKAQGGINMLFPGAYAPKSRDEKYNTYPSIKSTSKPKAKPKSSIQEATPQEIKKYGMMGTRSAKKGATVKKAKAGTSMKKCKYGCK